jgi:hypothetical protein
MSDCALAITNAYRPAGQAAPKHYWCLYHVLKAYGEGAMQYLHDKSKADEAVKDFRQLVYEDMPDPEKSYQEFHSKWNEISHGFAKYVHKQWYKHYSNWATC